MESGAASPGAGSAWPRVSRAGGWHLAVTLAAVSLIALLPLLGTKRFYFFDDTQSGAVGIWYEFGRRIVEDHGIPMLLLDRFMAGNVLAEGQWGVFNPAIWVVSVSTYLSGNLLVVATVAKIVSMLVLATGVYLLARSYGAAPSWAAVAGTVAPFTGFTVYFDAASWVTGLFAFSGLPLAWWSLRRFRLAGTSPIVPFAVSYLVITVGYVHGTLMLAAAIGGLLIEAILGRDRSGAVKTFVLGSLAGAVAIATYLPGILTSSVTWRTSWGASNDNLLSMDPGALFASALPSYRPWIASFGGVGAMAAPIAYGSWMLALLVLVNWSRLKWHWRSYAALPIVMVFAFILTFGPSALGPLRFPVRLIPYMFLPVIVATSVLVSRAGLSLTRVRITALVAATGLATYLAFAEYPRGWLTHLIGAILMGGGTLVVAGLHLRRDSLGLVASVAITASCLGLQVVAMPHSTLPDFGLPTKSAEYAGRLPSGSAPLYVSGNPIGLGEPWDVTSLGNGWAVARVATTNVYTPIGFAALGTDLCQEAHGTTCDEGVKKVFVTDPTTGRSVADLLGIDAVQILSRDQAALSQRAPSGWHTAASTTRSVLWQRQAATSPLGSPTWMSQGTVVHVKELTDQRTSFVVETAAEGSTVVFSRLAWPGYTTSAGSFTPPLRGYLLTLRLGPGDVGKTVEVSFVPAGWNVAIGCLIGALVVVTGWSLHGLGRRLRRRTREAAG